jgi:hypothetical protein
MAIFTFLARSQNFDKRLLSSSCPAAFPHRTQLPLDGFSWNLISEYFSKKKNYRENSTLVNPLTPELNPSAQRCLTWFLLGILLLEPCISLIHAWKTNKYTNYSFSILIMYGSFYMFRHYTAIIKSKNVKIEVGGLTVPRGCHSFGLAYLKWIKITSHGCKKQMHNTTLYTNTAKLCQ